MTGRHDDETACWCALNRIFGFEPKAGHALVEQAGSASGVFGMDEEQLGEILGPFSRFRSGIREEAVRQSKEELLRLEASGCRFLAFSDSAYPSLLKECEDPPMGLYYMGVSDPGEIFGNPVSISMVGTRDISPYGEEWCRRIVYALARSGVRPTVVSGLALGTDICVHRAALDAGLPTIAVMATGIDGVYPYRHIADARRIASTPGCALVTDYPPGTVPVKINFLRRNRIIAGMSMATLLTESRVKGGGMMTANLAFSYGREVYALPGRIDDTRSQGCNMLIHNHIAEPISDLEEFGRDIGVQLGVRRDRSPAQRVRLTFGDRLSTEKQDKMISLLEKIRQNRGMMPEELATVCGTGIGETTELCCLMEAEGLVSSDLLRRYSYRSESM